MNAVILGCSSMVLHIKAAQEKMKTTHPTIWVDKNYHMEPKEMRLKLLETIAQLASEADTVLAAMGFCGGSWNEVVIEKRLVIPRVDDCITLLLHNDESWHLNLKKPGHFYMRDSGSGSYSLEAMRQKLIAKHGEKKANALFEAWFEHYTDIDIIETGVYDCRKKEYLEIAEQNAKLTNTTVNHVPGSNILMEKLVSGRWDEQFLVVEAGHMITGKDFTASHQTDRFM